MSISTEMGCCHCQRPAETKISGQRYCWDCASNPLVVLHPRRPPYVPPEEFSDYMAYVMLTQMSIETSYGADERAPFYLTDLGEAALAECLA